MNGNGKKRRRAIDRCEDVAELLTWGESPEHIADRLGSTLQGLARNLHRHGYHRQAAQFDRAVRATRTTTCVDCGATIRWDSTRCRTCEGRRRRAPSLCACGEPAARGGQCWRHYRQAAA